MDSLLPRVADMADFIALMQRTEAIHGFLSPIEGYVLYSLAAEGDGLGEIVEVGSLFGKSACWLAAGAKKTRREKVTAIDRFSVLPDQACEKLSDIEDGQLTANTDEAILSAPENKGRGLHLFEETIRSFGLSDYVQPIVATSEEAFQTWDKPIRLLFLDADHAYASIKHDTECWSPFIVPGGHIVFHDLGEWPGVTQFYDEFTKADNGFTHLFQVGRVGVSQKD